MTFGDFSKGMTKVLTTALVIGAGIVINPYKTGVLKIDTPDGGFTGFAKSSYGIDNIFTTAMSFSCEPVKGGAKFVVEEHGPYTSTQDNKTEFYPESCQAGFDALFGRRSSFTRLYEMPDHDRMRDLRKNWPHNRVTGTYSCKNNGVVISGEDHADGTGKLTADWDVKVKNDLDLSGIHIEGFSTNIIAQDSYTKQAHSLCEANLPSKAVMTPNNALTQIYAQNGSVFVTSGLGLTFALRGIKMQAVEVPGNPTRTTIEKAIKLIDKTSNGAVRVGDMSSLFTTMTGVKLELK